MKQVLFSLSLYALGQCPLCAQITTMPPWDTGNRYVQTPRRICDAMTHLHEGDTCRAIYERTRSRQPRRNNISTTSPPDDGQSYYLKSGIFYTED